MILQKSFESMRTYHQQLELTTPAICYNGAKVVKHSGNSIEYPVAPEEVKAMITIAREKKIHLNF
jgi:hydroxymethylpyrimidine pyrophosphatase-like HAD family hydrolase